jgi:SAM-dependent methyltransferase
LNSGGPERLPSEYRTLFDARGARYNRANRLFPRARAEEARRLLAHLPLDRGARWLDVGAGGGFLAGEARLDAATAVGCDESAVFLGEASEYALRTLVDYRALPFAPDCFDAAASLAALHHADEPRAVLGEMLRVVRPGGRVAIGDVAAGSAAAGFLNGFVHAHTDMGHRGRFYSSSEWIGFLASAGGRETRGAAETLHWRFGSSEDAAAFCRELFGLRDDTSEDVLARALATLGLRGTGGDWVLPWDMVFASAAA